MTPPITCPEMFCRKAPIFQINENIIAITADAIIMQELKTFASVTRSIKWYGTSYATIFGLKAGVTIMIISTALRNGIMLIAVILLLVIF
jgi:hypothetical protein